MGPHANEGAKGSWTSLTSVLGSCGEWWLRMGWQPREAEPCLGPLFSPPTWAWPLRPSQAQGYPREDVATVTRKGSGGSKKQFQACRVKPHWGAGSGLGQLPGNTPPGCGGWAPLPSPHSQHGPGLGPAHRGASRLVGRWSGGIWEPLLRARDSKEALAEG